MPINARGNYQYTETDTYASASELLNKQTQAQDAKMNVDGGQFTMTLPPNEIVRVTVQHDLGVPPVSMWAQPRNPLSQQSGIQMRTYSSNAEELVIEARYTGASMVAQLVAWGVIG